VRQAVSVCVCLSVCVCMRVYICLCVCQQLGRIPSTGHAPSKHSAFLLWLSCAPQPLPDVPAIAAFLCDECLAIKKRSCSLYRTPCSVLKCVLLAGREISRRNTAVLSGDNGWKHSH